MKTGEATSAGEGLLVGGGALVLIAAILMIVGAIMNIFGVNRAPKNEDAFKNALIALCVGILSNILISAFSSNPAVSNIGKAVTTVTEMSASFFICTGIMNPRGDKVTDTSSSRATMLFAPSGFAVSISEHIKKKDKD